MQNCNIKQNRSNDFEIIVGRNTIVQESSIKFDISESISTDADAPVVTIVQLAKVDDGRAVSLIARVMEKEPARVVSTGVVQNVLIADEGGSIRLSIWEQ